MIKVYRIHITHRRKRTALIILSLLLPATACAQQFTVQEIIKKSDFILNPEIDYSMDVTITDTRPQKPDVVKKFEAFFKGKDKTLLKTISPENERGRNLLYLGRKLWVYLPNVRKPFSLTLSQRLTGEVSNADIARSNYPRDYDAKLLRIEKLNGRPAYVLELKVISPDIPYHRIIYWIEKGSCSPIKAKFYSLSGFLLKECFYEDYRLIFGTLRPTKYILKDPLVEGKMSIIEFSNAKAVDLPEKFFVKCYLDKMK